MHAFVLAYLCAGLSISFFFGVPSEFVPVRYALYVAQGFGLAAVVLCGLCALISGEPFAALRRMWLAAPRHLPSILLVASLTLHLGVFTALKTQMPDITPFFADVHLASLDEWIHGSAPWEHTTGILPASFTTIAMAVYYGVWGLLLPGGVLACLFLPQLRAVRSQYLWTHLLMWPVLGNVVAGVALSAGPIYYAQVTGDHVRFAGLAAFLEQALPSFAKEGVQILWRAHVSGEIVPAAGISAFPSLHLANATLIVLLVWRFGLWVRVTALLFCAAILFLSVHLGWHYAVDGYFSIAATVALWHLIGVVRGKTIAK